MSWLGRAFSEKDGTPSSSRLVTGWNAVVSAAVLIILAVAIVKADEHKAAIICGSFAVIIGALAAYIGVTYGLNRGLKDKPTGPDQTQPPAKQG